MLELYLNNDIQSLPPSFDNVMERLIGELCNQPGTNKLNQEKLALAYLYLTYRIVSGADKQIAEQWFNTLDKQYLAKSEDAVYQQKRARYLIGDKERLAELNSRGNSPKFFYCEDGYEAMNRTINNRLKAFLPLG